MIEANMVLCNQSVRTPKRMSWELAVDPCPYFDNYSKYITESEMTFQFARQVMPDNPNFVSAHIPNKTQKRSKYRDDEWIAK